MTGFDVIDTQEKFNALYSDNWATGTKKKIVVVGRMLWDNDAHVAIDPNANLDRCYGDRPGSAYIFAGASGWSILHEWGHANGALDNQYDANGPYCGFEKNIMGARDQGYVLTTQGSGF